MKPQNENCHDIVLFVYRVFLEEYAKMQIISRLTLLKVKKLDPLAFAKGFNRCQIIHLLLLDSLGQQKSQTA
jgi:hypothetical protein